MYQIFRVWCINVPNGNSEPDYMRDDRSLIFFDTDSIPNPNCLITIPTPVLVRVINSYYCLTFDINFVLVILQQFLRHILPQSLFHKTYN